jgi:uncharacterized SAM-binding protein YcdF (DUF218 family)
MGLARAWRISVKGRRPVLLTITFGGILLFSLNLFAWVLSRLLEVWYDQGSATRNARSYSRIIWQCESTIAQSPLFVRFPGHLDDFSMVFGFSSIGNHQYDSGVCGGTQNAKEPYSKTMRRVLEAEGVPPDLIWTEERSRSTYENAVCGSEVLRNHGVSSIALVAEANSMPRAAACFRKAGITVMPAPLPGVHGYFSESAGDRIEW